MTVTFNPPLTILLISLGVLAVGGASLALKKGGGKRKIASAVILVVTVALLLGFLYRRTSLTIDQNGLRATTMGRPSFSWSDVQKAVYIPDLANSDYRPTVRIGGSAMGTRRTGRFRLADGKTAIVVMTQEKDAILFQTGNALYLIALDDMQALKDEVSKYITLQ